MVGPAKAVRVIIVGMCALAVLVLSEAAALAHWTQWDVGSPIINAAITSPANGAYVAAGSEVTCTVNGGTDKDHYAWKGDEDDPQPWPEDTDDDEIPLTKQNGQPNFNWWASSGTFPYGSNGTSVTWKAGDTPGSVTIKCKADDKPKPMFTVRESVAFGTRDDDPVEPSVTVTVWDVTISKCNNQWPPTKDDTTPITATIAPGSVTGSIKFTLYGVSHEPGYCMNAGDETTTDRDLKFQDQAGFTISGGNNEVATTTSAVNSAMVTITCYDYGAWGQIKAEATVSGITKTAHIPESAVEYATIPLDEDATPNHIADGWAYNLGAATDDAENSPVGDGQPGDGFSRYQEYRGFLAKGTHIRTNASGQKDVFLCDREGVTMMGSNTGDDDFSDTGLTIHRIKTDGTEYDANRVMNFKKETAHLHDQCGLKLLDGGWSDDSYGETQGPEHGRTPNNVEYSKVFTQTIRYDGPDTQSKTVWDEKDVEFKRSVIGHELGHYVGLDDFLLHADCIMWNDLDVDWDNIPHTYDAYANEDCRHHFRLH